jgi:3-methyladenine DNA glycosylase AlkD
LRSDAYQEIKSRLQKLARSEDALSLQRFFKTAVGEYGEGDIFIGIKVPLLRKIAADLHEASFATISRLVKSRIHEERALALMILTRRFKRADDGARTQIYKFYLAHISYINNWDLVDGSAPYIVGPFLWRNSRQQLYKWARSSSVWERRISIIATFYFIRHNEFADAFKIARVLLADKHDLIHKAVGWMLREIAKRDQRRAEAFLKLHYRTMPRTMLRYAIERFPESKRQRYLKGKI